MKPLITSYEYIVQNGNTSYFTNPNGNLKRYPCIRDCRRRCEMKAIPVCSGNGSIDHYHAIFSKDYFRYIEEEDFKTIEEAGVWLTSKYSKELEEKRIAKE